MCNACALFLHRLHNADEKHAQGECNVYTVCRIVYATYCCYIACTMRAQCADNACATLTQSIDNVHTIYIYIFIYKILVVKRIRYINNKRTASFTINRMLCVQCTNSAHAARILRIHADALRTHLIRTTILKRCGLSQHVLVMIIEHRFQFL